MSVCALLLARVLGTAQGRLHEATPILPGAGWDGRLSTGDAPGEREASKSRHGHMESAPAAHGTEGANSLNVLVRTCRVVFV